MESTDPAVRELARVVQDGRLTARERAVAAFDRVRDGVSYEFMAKLRPEEYTASHVLGRGRGFCVQKAVLLVSLLRASGVPSALVLTDLRDHTMPRRIAHAMGTDVMHGHGLAAAWVDGGGAWQTPATTRASLSGRATGWWSGAGKATRCSR